MPPTRRYYTDGFDGCYTVDIPAYVGAEYSMFVADMVDFHIPGEIPVTERLDDAHRFHDLSEAEAIADRMNNDIFWRRSDRQWEPHYRLLNPPLDMSELTPGVIK